MTNDGFTVGLKLWIVFMVAFALLQYPVVLSILLGALGGWAGGSIARYLKQTKPITETDRPSQLSGLSKRLTSQFGWRQDAADAVAARKEQASDRASRRGGLTRRKPPSFRSRR